MWYQIESSQGQKGKSIKLCPRYFHFQINQDTPTLPQSVADVRQHEFQETYHAFHSRSKEWMWAFAVTPLTVEPNLFRFQVLYSLSCTAKPCQTVFLINTLFTITEHQILQMEIFRPTVFSVSAIIHVFICFFPHLPALLLFHLAHLFTWDIHSPPAQRVMLSILQPSRLQ